MYSHNSGLWAILKPLAYTSTIIVGVNMASTSILYIPSLLQPITSIPNTPSQTSPSTIVEQFTSVNTLSMKYNIPLEVITIISYAALAYRAQSAGSLSSAGLGTRKGWIIAAAVLSTIFPFKNIFMAPVAAKLAALAKESKPGDASSASSVARDQQRANIVQQIGKWNTMNLARSVIVLASGVIAWNGTQ